MLLSAAALSEIPISDALPVIALAECSIAVTSFVGGASTRVDARAVVTIESESGEMIGPLWVPIPESLDDPWTLIPE